MKNYLDIANHPLLYGIVFFLLSLIIGQAVIFIRLSLHRAKHLGIEKQKLIKAAKTAAITSVVPSIAIVIALATLVPLLGMPISWGRLSVIGSLSYELLAADIGAGTFHTELGSAVYNSQTFLTSVITMTVGSFVTLGLTIFIFKGYKNSLNKKLNRNKDSQWSRLLIITIMVAMYSRFLAEPIAVGGISFVTMAVSAVTMLLLGVLIKKLKWNWMKDFAISFSMITAMIAAVILVRIL